MRKKELLVKYILGILSTKERQLLDLWMKESPNNALYLEKLKKRNYSERYQEYKRSHRNFSVRQSGWKHVLGASGLLDDPCASSIQPISRTALGQRDTK